MDVFGAAGWSLIRIVLVAAVASAGQPVLAADWTLLKPPPPAAGFLSVPDDTVPSAVYLCTNGGCSGHSVTCLSRHFPQRDWWTTIDQVGPAVLQAVKLISVLEDALLLIGSDEPSERLETDFLAPDRSITRDLLQWRMRVWSIDLAGHQSGRTLRFGLWIQGRSLNTVLCVADTAFEDPQFQQLAQFLVFVTGQLTK